MTNRDEIDALADRIYETLVFCGSQPVESLQRRVGAQCQMKFIRALAVLADECVIEFHCVDKKTWICKAADAVEATISKYSSFFPESSGEIENAVT